MTRFVKIAAAIVLVLVAIFIAAGEASLLFDPPDAKLGEDFDSSGKLRLPWHQHARTILFVSLCLCGAYLLVRRRVTDPVAEIHCPPLPGTRWAYACTDLRAIDESVRVTLWGTI